MTLRCGLQHQIPVVEVLFGVASDIKIGKGLERICPDLHTKRLLAFCGFSNHRTFEWDDAKYVRNSSFGGLSKRKKRLMMCSIVHKKSIFETYLFGFHIIQHIINQNKPPLLPIADYMPLLV
mgnify:CR=1 FL=1